MKYCSRRDLLLSLVGAGSIGVSGCGGNGSLQESNPTNTMSPTKRETKSPSAKSPSKTSDSPSPTSRETQSPTEPPSLPTLNDSWSQFHRDPANTGYAPEMIGSQSKGNRINFHEEVRRGTGEPVVVNNTIYLTAGYDLLSINPQTLAIEHEYLKGFNDLQTSAVYGSPAIVDESIYVGLNEQGVVSFNLNSGDINWHNQTVGTINPYQSSPVIRGDFLYISSMDGNLYALDRTTGEVTWTFETGDSILASPAVGDTNVYVGSHDKRFYAIHRESGKKQWHFDSNPKIGNTPALADGTVYFGNYSNCFAISIETGEMEWKFTDRGGSIAPVITDRYVIFASSVISAVHRDSGEEKWAFQGRDNPKNTIVGAGGVIYAGTNLEDVFAIALESGEQLWRGDPGKEPVKGLSVVDGTVLAAAEDGLVAFSSE